MWKEQSKLGEEERTKNERHRLFTIHLIIHHHHDASRSSSWLFSTTTIVVINSAPCNCNKRCDRARGQSQKTMRRQCAFYNTVTGKSQCAPSVNRWMDGSKFFKFSTLDNKQQKSGFSFFPLAVVVAPPTKAS